MLFPFFFGNAAIWWNEIPIVSNISLFVEFCFFLLVCFFFRSYCLPPRNILLLSVIREKGSRRTITLISFFIFLAFLLVESSNGGENARNAMKRLLKSLKINAMIQRNSSILKTWKTFCLNLNNDSKLRWKTLKTTSKNFVSLIKFQSIFRILFKMFLCKVLLYCLFLVLCTIS